MCASLNRFNTMREWFAHSLRSVRNHTMAGHSQSDWAVQLLLNLLRLPRPLPEFGGQPLETGESIMLQELAMRLVVDVPAHELSNAGCEKFAHILRFNVAICAGAISQPAMPFEGRLLLRRGLGIKSVPAVYPRGWPDQPAVAHYTVFRGIFRPQKTIAYDDEVAGRSNCGFRGGSVKASTGAPTGGERPPTPRLSQ